jgi:probable HAF family extracellular repeat protein
MKIRTLRCLTLLTLLAGFLAAALTAQEQPSNSLHYKVINLGTLGGTSSAGNGINNRGWVTGVASLPGDHNQHAALWAYGLKFDLGTLGGTNSAVLFPVKSTNGPIAGVSETPKQQPLGEDWSCSFFFPTITHQVCVGFVWNGHMTPLPTLGGDNGFAAGINNHEQVVGWAETSFHDPTCAGPQGRNQVLQFQAVIWSPDGTIQQQLSPLGDDPDSAAVAINDKGQVVGISGLCDQAVGRFSARHAVLWEDGTATDLGSFGGVAWNTPVAINQKGQVAGFSDFPGDQDGSLTSHAFFWTKETGIQDLGTLKGDFLSLGLGMNNHAQVVGESIGPNGPRAFLWQNGALLDLNSILPTGSSWSLLYAGDINDRGEITGGFVDRNSVECGPSAAGCAFLAIPANGRR